MSKKLFTLVVLVLSLNCFSSEAVFKVACTATNTLDTEPQRATIAGPLMDHDFRMRVWDINDRQVVTGRCYFDSKNGAVCFNKDMFGNDDEQVLSVTFNVEDMTKEVPESFTMVSDDNHSDYSIVWDCHRQ